MHELALNVYKLKYFKSEASPFKCSINPHAHWRIYTKGKFQAFFCNNFAMFGLNFRIPIHHPKRWIMSYCFTEEELSSLHWTKSGKYWISTLTNAIVTRQRKQFPLYSVFWTPTGDSCVFHLGRLGMAQPILDSCDPHSFVYTNNFEADSKAMGSILQKYRTDSMSSNILESMTHKILQHNRALEHDLFKLMAESSENKAISPSSQEWNHLVDRFAIAMSLDTPELTQHDEIIQNSSKTTSESSDYDGNILLDSSFTFFKPDQVNSNTQESSTNTQSSDSSL
jgi:hypothetical protein